MQLPQQFYQGRKLQSLVENQTSYDVNHAALHIFETHLQAERVLLEFDKPVLASMLQGKKVMHLQDLQSFDFLPGESLILPANEVMCIDFPEASMNNPTRCLAMAISEEKIGLVMDFMNETMPRIEGEDWSFLTYNFHFTNDHSIYEILKRLIFLFTENHPSKDYFVDNMLQELIIRILQSNARKLYTDQAISLASSHRLAYIVDYVRKNLHQPLSVESLSQKAYMSPSNFYRVFKNELGIAPVDFIINERIRLAVSMLRNPKRKIKDIFMDCGFDNRSYFNRVFKQKYGMTPKSFQKQIIQEQVQ
ncbi:MAG TPA: AraC family transcriptional regulator [Saprospiraceae bacterium]|nr:AraC family transcriptional regulator [Saprospiraceae bacterium]HPG08874.1 AraC family transcriptional regulator [Saprospiraceae bacterium]HRV85465.1 AraC family transcriptional regulator [Saprospiraceae bacterium]